MPMLFKRHVDGLQLPYGKEDTEVVPARVVRRFARNPEKFLADVHGRLQGQWDSSRVNEYAHQLMLDLHPNEHVALFQRLERTILPINDELWGLKLTYWHSGRLLLYPPGHGFHEMHIDYIDGEVAKLAFSLILKEAERGGELRLDNFTPRVPLRAGDLVVFPAYEPHEVRLVTKGTRISMTGWLGGPPLK